MFEPDYQRAVDVRDRSKIVYAYFHADKHCLFMPAEDYAFLGPIWIVWFPETIEYTALKPEQFDERYTLESQLPEDMRHTVSQYPSFTEWVVATKGIHSGPMQ